ncbi:class II fructose-bisphosphate aldolase, partial [Pseudomonas sp. Irchel 3E19]|uniref:class II fructose-bisphosphate aldolase n=1 Tax=Pseudomonas sp. Irchel 3E19 TaxID=2008981 RepID=UPI001482E76D
MRNILSIAELTHPPRARRKGEEIVEGIKYGVRKVNIDTDLRLASTGAMRRLMATNPSEFDPRKFFGATVTA